MVILNEEKAVQFPVGETGHEIGKIKVFIKEQAFQNVSIKF
jgi:hypothetical protein